MTVHDDGISNVFLREKKKKKLGRGAFVMVKYQDVPPCPPSCLRLHLSVFCFPPPDLHFQGATGRLDCVPTILRRPPTRIRQKRRQIYN